MRTARIAAAAAAVLAAAGTSLAGDFIQKKDGSFNPPLKGDAPAAADFEASTYQVLDADQANILWQMVTKERTLPPQKFPAADVAEIWLEAKDYPPQWKEANDLLQGGEGKKASAQFKAIGDEKKVHPVVRQKSLLYAARSLQGDPKAADAAYDYLVKAFPQTFYIAAVWKDRSQMWMDAGDEEKARTAADQLLKLPGVTDSDKLEARFLLVTIDFRRSAAAKDQPGVQKALDEYKKIGGETAGKKDLAGVNALARVGQANCQLELGAVAEAKGVFQEISERVAHEHVVLSAAFNGLGECWFREGKYDEARRCFLRTVTVYSEGAPGDQVARALYFAGECFFRIQDSDDWKDRARRELNECMRRFPNTSWAEKARRMLPNIPK